MEIYLEMSNVSKRQQPDQRVKNRRSPPMGLNNTTENSAPGGVIQLAPKEKYVLVH